MVKPCVRVKGEKQRQRPGQDPPSRNPPAKASLPMLYTKWPSHRLVIAIDLVFTKSGCRKTVRKYVSTKGRCPKCGEHYSPESFRGSHSHAFGHAFQAWSVYQRII